MFFSFCEIQCQNELPRHDSSGSNHSDDEMDLEAHSHSDSSQEDYNLEVGHDEENEETYSNSTDNWPPGPPATNCPSNLLAKWAWGTYDPKSPLKQFATRITAHFLFWTGKGVGLHVFDEMKICITELSSPIFGVFQMAWS